MSLLKFYLKLLVRRVIFCDATPITTGVHIYGERTPTKSLDKYKYV